MPLIYSGHCSACDAEIKHVSDGYIALYIDEPKNKPEKASGFTHPDDPQLVILAHPCEDTILQSHGYIQEQAAWQGRLVRVQKVYCQVCGHNFEIRRISAGLNDFGCVGCLIIIALGVLIGFGVHHVSDHEILAIIVGIVSIFSLMTVLDWSTRSFVLWKFAERAARVATPKECPNCKGQNYASPSQLNAPIPCLKCGKRSMSFKVTGKS